MHMDKHRVEYAYLPDLLARVCIFLVLHMHKFWATFGRVRDGVLLFCVHTEADTQVGLGHTVTHVEVLFQLLRSS